MDMFDCIAERIASFIMVRVATAVFLSGYTGGYGEHKCCPDSDKVAHRENSYG